MKVPMLVLTLALLVGGSQAQESVLLPRGPWVAFDAGPVPTTLLGERQRRLLLDGALRSVERLHVDPDFDGVDLEDLRQAYEGWIAAARGDREVAVLQQETLAWVDGYYRSREERELELARVAFTGIGIQISILSDGHVLGINHVFPGSRAHAAGLAAAIAS